MAFDWKSIVGTVAPGLATALLGPLGGLATKAIVDALGLPANSGEAEIAAAVASATPEQLLALKKADHDFAIRMKELDVDLDRIMVGDRDGARQREIQVKDKIPGILAVLTVGGFFLILGAMSWGLVSGNVTKSEAFLIMLGVLGAMTKDIYSYYFGSSASSRAKDDTIKKLSA